MSSIKRSEFPPPTRPGFRWIPCVRYETRKVDYTYTAADVRFAIIHRMRMRTAGQVVTQRSVVIVEYWAEEPLEPWPPRQADAS